jgi:hypothetical protein
VAVQRLGDGNLVPTPSVEVASTGCFRRARELASKRPAKPPMSPITSGRRVLATHSLIRSTARSPASISTPAAAYADLSASVVALAAIDADKSAGIRGGRGHLRHRLRRPPARGRRDPRGWTCPIAH